MVAEMGSPQKAVGENEKVTTESAYLRILPQLNTFLGCCTLRTGTKIIGWFYAVGSVFTALCISAALVCCAFVITNKETDDSKKSVLLNAILLLAGALVLILITVVTSIRLLVGVHKRKSGLLKPFIVMLYAYLIADVLIWLIELETGMMKLHLDKVAPNHQFGMTNPLTIIFRFLSGCYILMVVNSHHRELRDQSFGYKPQV